jgi:hypothetical protein
MHEEAPGKSHHVSLIVWIFVSLLVVLYVLSSGPALQWARRQPMTDGISGASEVRLFYTPIKWLYEHTPLNKPLG